MMNEQNTPKTKEQKMITQLYGAFVAAFVMSFIPVQIVSVFGNLLFLAVLIWAYILKAKAEKESLIENHTLYIIRTIWISSVFLGIGIVAASFMADNTAIHDFMEQMKAGYLPQENDIQNVLNRYYASNLHVFVMTLGPSVLYLIYRIGKGLTRATKGYRLAQPREWL